MGMERAAQAVDADPVAGALIAQPRTPAAGAFASAIGRAAHGVRAGAGNLQDSGTAAKGSIEGDGFVADNLCALRTEIKQNRCDPLLDAGHGGRGHAHRGGAYTAHAGIVEGLFKQRAQIGFRHFRTYAQALDGTALRVSQNPFPLQNGGAGACSSAVDSQNHVHCLLAPCR